MALQYILCPITGGEEDKAALRASLQLSERFDAHVRALFVRSLLTAAIPYLGEGLTGDVVDNIVTAANSASDKSLVAAKGHVDEALRASCLDASRLSLRVTEGVLEDEIAAASRLADLIVYARDPGDAAFPDRSLAEHTLLSARRPILIAPPQPMEMIGSKVAVLWDGRTEAAAAVIAALPFIRKASAVEVIHMSNAEDGPAVLEDLKDALTLRGLEAEMHVIEPHASIDGAKLMSAALATEPDLIVMGGYSHSRLRQLVLGGVTRHMLKHSPVPLLMSH